MPKIRQTVSVVFEYEPNPAHYPDGATIDDMALTDAQSYEEGEILIEALANGEEKSISVHSEIIPD
jgi:hypothetical protein